MQASAKVSLTSEPGGLRNWLGTLFAEPDIAGAYESTCARAPMDNLLVVSQPSQYLRRRTSPTNLQLLNYTTRMKCNMTLDVLLRLLCCQCTRPTRPAKDTQHNTELISTK